MNNQPKAYILTKTNRNEIQRSSVYATKSLSGMIKTCLGPKAMQKMVLTKLRTIEHTNDGLSILREMDVGHPSARCLIDLSQTQDDECGDGTTSVVVLAAELLEKMVKLLEKHHPIKICRELGKIREKVLEFLTTFTEENENNPREILKIVKASVATKFCSQIRVPIPEMAFESIMKIKDDKATIVCDIKNNVKIIKMLGDFKECKVMDGIVLDKDIVHAQMKREFDNPKILLTDCALEYKKGESATNLEFDSPEDFSNILKSEENQIKKMCGMIIKLKPDIVVCEKGVCDLALSILQENNITCLRRTTKTELIRLAKATGSTVVARLEDATDKHIGSCGKFEYKRIGQQFYSIFSKCQNPKAINVILSGPTKDINNELERNFTDAIKVARNMIADRRILPGGGATEMGVSVFCSSIESQTEIEKDVLDGVTEAFKVISSILLTNSGVSNTLEKVCELFKKQKETGNCALGVNGMTGELVDMKNIVNEPFIVKSQCFKSVFESVIQLLRIDGIIECVKTTPEE